MQREIIAMSGEDSTEGPDKFFGKQLDGGHQGVHQSRQNNQETHQVRNILAQDVWLGW
jgi:hypothetical protein